MKKNNRIAIITPYGAEPSRDHYAEFLLAKGLKDLGYQVNFYTYKLKKIPGYQGNLTYQGVNVIRCQQRFGISPSLIFRLIHYRPRVVLYFHPRSFLSFSAYLGAKIVGAKTISEIVGILHDPFIVKDRDNPIDNFLPQINLITDIKKLVTALLQGNIYAHWLNFIFHMPVAKADTIVAINQDEQFYIKKFYHRDSELIYWASPANPMSEQVKPAGVIPGQYLFFIGMVKKRKGWDTAIEAVEKLKRQGLHKNLVFVSPSDNAEAVDYARQLGIDGQIYFFQKITNAEKNWFYAHAQFILAPSRYEGFGLPVFEAFTAGKPLLATDIAVYLEFLEHKKNAMISKCGDSSGLADNIRELDANPALAESLVINGKKTAAQFSAAVMINKFVNLIG